MCNLYLQSRGTAKTPRWRGITLVHEMKQRGISVSFASDNTRDPFYAYGDLDMLEVMREATRIGHLDHSDSDWTHAFTTNPARTTGFATPSLEAGAPADLVICKARICAGTDTCPWSVIFDSIRFGPHFRSLRVVSHDCRSSFPLPWQGDILVA